jgi:DNA modification methylase
VSVRFIHGDCRDVLPTLEEDSFDCVVTSPPYWGLRDYGVDGQIGLEPTLDAYVETMVGVGRELKRVLKPGGTFWLNLGDSYAGYHGNKNSQIPTSATNGWTNGTNENLRTSTANRNGLKPKDLCGVPWKVAFALQADGWWLRSAIVWAKPNPMPESVTDRPTSAYEMVFLLTKSERYFYDAEAIAEETICDRDGIVTGRGTTGWTQARGNERSTSGGFGYQATRNARNVWTISTQPFKGSHFATMPPDLAERCIKAGCPSKGHVLDPFSGAGTTALVADRLGRHCTGIELNPSYRDMGAERVSADAPLFASVESA